MNPKRRGLGQGLGALIRNDALPPAAEAGESPLQIVPIEQITPNPHQPRQHFSSEALAELSESIRTHGIIQPLVVTRAAQGFMIIAGERRWRASQQAGLRELPVIIKDVSDQERVELALVENIQRADLDPLEEAQAYLVLQEDFGLSHKEIGARVGKSRSTISNALRLLRLPEVLQQAVIDNRLTAGHLRQLITIEDERTQILAMEQILEHRLTVREAEKLAQLIKHNGQTPAQARIAIQQTGAQPRASRQAVRAGEPATPLAAGLPAPADIDAAAVVEELTRQLGTKVELRRDGKTSYLRIEFYDDEQLNSLILLLTGQEPSP
ncbi:MAG TPA: ParB/RepB/Spo0J family partition protein [Herpetosiphonaceae bacterium]